MKIYDPKKILVPVDFSRLSIEALRVGLEIAQLRNIDVTPLHVAKEPEEHIPHRVYGEQIIPILGEGVAPAIPFSKTLDGIRMDLEKEIVFMLKRPFCKTKYQARCIFWRSNPGDPPCCCIG